MRQRVLEATFTMAIAIIAQWFVIGSVSTTEASQKSGPQLQPTVPPYQNPLPDLPAIRVADHRTSSETQHFVRFGQCQIEFEMSPSKANTQSVWYATHPDILISNLEACLNTGLAEKLDVLVLPELALTLPEDLREKFLRKASTIAKSKSMIIVAGSYYDKERHNRLAVVGPGWVELGYKVRPSRLEVSPRDGEGMKPGNEILVLQTDLGNFAVITCVDLISDEVQFQVRRLATRGKIDVLMVINYNPAAWEFLVEANSIVRRHPIFASITNVFSSKSSSSNKTKHRDTRYSYGHTAVFASLRTDKGFPNSSKRIHDLIPDYFLKMEGGEVKRRVPYDNIVGDIEAFREGLLVYELNMWLKRVPANTNAPDQGYPPIRGVKIVDLQRQSPKLSTAVSK